MRAVLRNHVSRETVRWNNRGHCMVFANHSKCAIVRRNYKGISMVIVHHPSRRLRRANTMCGAVGNAIIVRGNSMLQYDGSSGPYVQLLCIVLRYYKLSPNGLATPRDSGL
jgi:hypothetical protein